MGRLKCASRDSGLINRRATPLKTARSRRVECKRLLPNKRYEAIPEEAWMEEINVLTVRPCNPVVTCAKPDHRKCALRLRRSAFTENPRGKAVSPVKLANKKLSHQVSPAGHTTIPMTLDVKALKDGEMQVKDEEENLAMSLESMTSLSIESETTLSSDDDDEEDCYSSDSSASSSLPSPEIFRNENYVETSTFPMKEELLGLHLRIKNSTLLDVSHAESINMHQPPNLSTIIDASTILAENSCEITQHSRPEDKTKLHADSFKSAVQGKTPSKVTITRPILCKKKVWFKSPVIAESFEAKHIPASKLTTHKASELVETASPAKQMKPDPDTSTAGEIDSEKEVLKLTVRLKRPVESNPEKARFFDFINDNDRDVFFQRMRERCAKLRSAPLFPLTAAKHIEPSVL